MKGAHGGSFAALLAQAVPGMCSEPLVSTLVTTRGDRSMYATATGVPAGLVKTSSFDGRPWFRRGGMFINTFGMAFNNTLPAFWLAVALPTLLQRCAFLALYLASCYGAYLTGKQTVYCKVVVPLYMCSLLLAFGLPRHPLLCLAVALTVGIAKVNICMSVCLHRFASHAAFQCSTPVKYVMAILGCLANQGGPIWWGSQHRCHHKYCDVSRDPHSPTVSGIERAFAFFGIHKAVEEDFAPQHLDSVPMRILDTWAFLVVSTEFLLAWKLFGNVGLFCSYVSGWICQTITLWFNVANHPPKLDKKCKATDARAPILYEECGWYLPFYFLDALYPLYSAIVMEGEHQHHHDHANLAKRSKYDTAYYGFIRPLELLGLVWKVNAGCEFK